MTHLHDKKEKYAKQLQSFSYFWSQAGTEICDLLLQLPILCLLISPRNTTGRCSLLQEPKNLYY